MSPIRASAILLSCSLAAPAHAWDAVTHERVAMLAARLMPPTLQAQLARHKDELLAGARAGDPGSAPEGTLHADGSGGTLDRDVASSIERGVALVREQRGFAELALEMGRLSHLAADAAFPLNTSASDPREAMYYADFTAYAASKLDKFPPVFDGFARFDQGFDPAAYVRSVAENANRVYPLVGRAYFPQGGGAMTSSKRFDDRGPAFGIAQMSFVHAVSATANLWLHLWREAHGDLAGTPFYRQAKGLPGAENRARPAERP